MLCPIHAGDDQKRDLGAALAWLGASRETLVGRLYRDGALLLRGFPLADEGHFRRVLKVFADPGEDLIDYESGASPRKIAARKIYTSTEAPPFVRILQHQEMSYLPAYPTKLGFYCATPAAEGGETPLADARAILRAMPADVVDAVSERKLTYSRRMKAIGPGRRILRGISPTLVAASWNVVYGTDDRHEAEAACARSNLAWHWEGEGTLVTENRVEGVRSHPVTGEAVWFNTMHNFVHERHMFGKVLGPVFRAAQRLGGEGYRLTYGDGGTIPAPVKETALAVVSDHVTAFRWQAGDMLILDNLLMMHGRNPYKGKRRVLVGMLGRTAGGAAPGGGAPEWEGTAAG